MTGFEIMIILCCMVLSFAVILCRIEVENIRRKVNNISDRIYEKSEKFESMGPEYEISANEMKKIADMLDDIL